jgi:hypothetical protein
MPLPVKDFTKGAINKLNNDLSLKLGQSIKSLNDCKKIALLLETECNTIISPNTIARAFNILKCNSKPSKYTLDVLSEYTCNSNWNTYYNNHQLSLRDGVTGFTSNAHNSNISENEILLFKYCLDDYSFSPIIKYLKNWAKDYIDSDKSKFDYQIISSLGNVLRKDPVIQKNLMPIITKDDDLRTFFFDFWVDRDGLNTYYAKLIENEYVKNISPKHSTFHKDKIWANCILLSHYLDTGNNIQFLRTGFKLFSAYNPEKVTIDYLTENGIDGTYPFARFHANHIVYKYFSNSKTPVNWYEEKIRFIIDQITPLSSKNHNLIIPLIVEALFISKNCELIFSFSNFIEELLNNSMKNNTFLVDDSAIQSLIFYLHLSISKTDSNRNIALNEKVFIFPKGTIFDLETSDLNVNNLMNNVIKSYYTNDKSEKMALLKTADSIASKIKSNYFKNLIKTLAMQVNCF